MRFSSRASRIAAAIVVSAMGLMGCADEDGQALPSNGTATPNTDASSQAPVQLEAINACDLLGDDEAATLSPGLAVEDLGSSGAHSVCRWSTSVDKGVPIDEGVTFGIATRPTQDLDDLQSLDGGKVTDGKVGQRSAKIIAEDGRIEGSCVLGIEVGTGRVDINVEAKKTDRACQIASDISTIIEPKLPQE